MSTSFVSNRTSSNHVISRFPPKRVARRTTATYMEKVVFALTLVCREIADKVARVFSSIMCFCGRRERSTKAWWNVIPLGTDRPMLYLGGIPFKNGAFGQKLSHGDALRDLGIKSVLSVTRSPETNHRFVAETVRKRAWERLNIKHRQIGVDPSKSATMRNLFEGSRWIHDSVRRKRPVFVHSKTGGGRSADFVIAYLMRYKKMTAKAAVNLVKESRPQGKMMNRQLTNARKFEQALKDRSVKPRKRSRRVS